MMMMIEIVIALALAIPIATGVVRILMRLAEEANYDAERWETFVLRSQERR